jgi:hypothetical protein
MSDETDLQSEERPGWIFAARLGLGVAQGLALYLLYSAYDAQQWPAQVPLLFGPLLVVFLFLPPLASQALGGVRVRTLLAWMALLAVLLAALAAYDVWSAWPVDIDHDYRARIDIARPHLMPSFAFFAFAAAGLFIGHALMAGGDADRRLMARYTVHYDIAWKLAVQAGLSVVFVGVFWLLLEMGAGLFALIKLDFFRRLIAHDWFAIPATAMAAAAAIHLTDVRAGLVRGARTLILLLLSWLLPLTVLIVVGFLASLIVTGLDPLWKIGHASALLLTAAAVLIVLINAAHQDGAPERAPPGILRIAGTIGSVALIPLVGLAARALFLRVSQYGWTNDRVATAACVVVAATYAIGYVIAATPSGAWLKRIETWNFCAALFILAVLLALATPIASPARISVADQMARATPQTFKAGKFDFAYLRWSGGRYGQEALTKLAASKDPNIANAARAQLASTNRYMAMPPTIAPRGTLSQRITVFPAGQKLPASFYAKLWNPDSDLPGCITDADARCYAIEADLDGDGVNEIILFDADQPTAYFFGDTGGWQFIGASPYATSCTAIQENLRAGLFHATPPAHRWNDLIVGGFRLHVPDRPVAPGPPVAPGCR